MRLVTKCQNSVTLHSRRQAAAPDSPEIRVEVKARWNIVRLGPDLAKETKQIKARSQRYGTVGRQGHCGIL